MRRRYEVVALSVPIVYNRFGDHDPNGMLYVLREHASRLEEEVRRHPLQPVAMVQPLVLRANEGDEVEVLFQNRLPFPASINLKGLPLDPRTADGSLVGRNPSTLARPGGRARYLWKADRQGIYHFGDLGNPVSTEQGSQVHGLWGALIVEAPGSQWTDPETGAPLESGIIADIHNPFLPSFREYVIFFHDEPEIQTADGGVPTNPMNGEPESTMPVNYRSEPMRNRVRLIQDGRACSGCVGEEVHHDSWAFGDPAVPVARGYRGDPFRFRFLHGGIKETHLFHLHAHQWKSEPNDPDSNVIDAISVSPQGTATIDLLYGVGSLHRAKGDSIWHCHLYPHFGEGMFSILRSHDVLEDGSRLYPDGTPITALRPLPDRAPPPRPTAERPGFPLFVPGTFGEKAPTPPFVNGRPPTPLEAAAMDPRGRPGAVFANPCPPGVPERRFYIVAIQREIVYNRSGWHDPQGRLFVLMEDLEAVLRGEKEPEPLVIRGNAGECIVIEFTNLLPDVIGGTVFQSLQATPECGVHVHLVKFDPLVSDGSNVGWNYDNGIRPGETRTFVWFNEAPFGTVLFHDHLFAATHQQHGLFGTFVSQTEGSTFHDPRTGSGIDAGGKAVIQHPYLPHFREQALGLQDFALLFDREGNPLNPPPVPDSFDDPGVMAISYRSEPFRERRGEPAHIFSSFVHGDPVTPLLEGYAGDPVRIRLLQGAHEEQHGFNLHRYRWRRERSSIDSPLASQQPIGISEAFTLEFALEGRGDFDALYHTGGIDDIWLGCWGIIRRWGARVPHLLPLQDREPPPPRRGPLPVRTGSPPPRAESPGDPAPPGVPVRRFDLVAVRKQVLYNRFGDHDPEGLLFVLRSELAPVLSGERNPEPLVLRACLGELVEVRLENRLPAALTQLPHPEVPVEAPWPPSSRVSLHPQGVAYEAGSDGAAVGFNRDGSIPPGESITYRWYLDQPVGGVILTGFGDLRNHRRHGLWGALVVEAPGAHPRDASGRRPPLGSTCAARIEHPYLPAKREFVLFQHDGANLFDARGERLPDAVDPDEPGEPDDRLDAEDQGQKCFNYRTERFTNRLDRLSDLSRVMSSIAHQDPATPLLEANQGDPVTVHLLMPADKPRNHSFTIHGHRWRRYPAYPAATLQAVVNAVTVGGHHPLDLEGGAGLPGDYAYRSGVLRWDLEMGMWGIFRVHPPAD
jgi:manganese oxidase